MLHRLHGGVDGHLGIERVEDGLNQQQVYPTLYQSFRLLYVGSKQLVVGQFAIGGIVHVGRHGASLVRRTYGSRHEAGLLLGGIAVGSLSRYPCSLQVHLPAERLQVIVGLRDALRVEGVGGDDVGPGLQVSLVYVGNHVGSGQVQHVVVSLQHACRPHEPVAVKVLFAKSILLHDGAHSPVENQDSSVDDVVYH